MAQRPSGWLAGAPVPAPAGAPGPLPREGHPLTVKNKGGLVFVLLFRCRLRGWFLRYRFYRRGRRDGTRCREALGCLGLQTAQPGQNPFRRVGQTAVTETDEAELRVHPPAGAAVEIRLGSLQEGHHLHQLCRRELLG